MFDGGYFLVLFVIVFVSMVVVSSIGKEKGVIF